MAKVKKAEFVVGLILEMTEENIFFEKDHNSNPNKKIIPPIGTHLKVVGRDKLYTEVIYFTVGQKPEIYAEHFKNLQEYKVINPTIIPVPTTKELDSQKEKKAIKKLNKEIQGNDDPNLFEAFLNEFPDYLKDKNNQKRLFLKCIQTQGSKCIDYGINKGWFKDIDLDKCLSVYGYRQFDSNLYFALEENSFAGAKFFMDRGATLDDLYSGPPIRYWLTWKHNKINSELVAKVFSYEEKLNLEKEVNTNLTDSTKITYKL